LTTTTSPAATVHTSTSDAASSNATVTSMMPRCTACLRLASALSAAPASGSSTGETARAPLVSATMSLLRSKRIAQRLGRPYIAADYGAMSAMHTQRERGENHGECESDDDGREDECLRNRVSRLDEAIGAVRDEGRKRRANPPGLEQHQVYGRREQREPEQHAHEVAGEHHVHSAAEKACRHERI